MSRNPFEPIDGCNRISFDVPVGCTWASRPQLPDVPTCLSVTAFTVPEYIPTYLPFCSIPPFTKPTFVPRELEVIVPDIALPDMCNCIVARRTSMPVSYGVSGTVLARPQFADRLTMYLSRVTRDCCSPELGFDLLVPCLPLAVNAGGDVHMSTHNSISVQAGMIQDRHNCRMSMFMDINIDGSDPSLQLNKTFSIKIECKVVTVTFGWLRMHSIGTFFADTTVINLAAEPLYWIYLEHYRDHSSTKITFSIAEPTSTTTILRLPLAKVTKNPVDGCYKKAFTCHDGDFNFDSPIM